MQIDAIVPAYNEAASVSDVVDILRRSPSIGRVLVVDDGSHDRTAARAACAGAEVVRLAPNRGKGQAMRIGLDRVGSDPVMYCDADLVGLLPEHVELLAQHARAGWDMVCGIRDYGLLLNPLQAIGPLITGERIVRRWILERIPRDCWSGYAIETAMNHACTGGGGRTTIVPMVGVGIRGKVKKAGIWAGLRGHYRTFRDILGVERNLACHGRCTLPGERPPPP